MKKYSDIFSGRKALANQVGRRLATAALLIMAATTIGFAQEPYRFIEGSVHKFSVADNPLNTFAWTMDIDPYNNVPMPANSYDLMDGGQNANLTIRFNDMDRVSEELVYLVVRETSPNGCSTRRAMQIMLEPNNMFLEFASANTQECFSMGNYDATLQVGMNFKNKAAGVPIPANLFPLKLNYEVRNVTDNGPVVQGNGGNAVEMAYSATNNYSLLIPQTEVPGNAARTIEYELTITSVTDKYDTEITKNTGDIRLQIRIINHLPQSGGMDMALAYMLTPISYMGARQ